MSKLNIDTFNEILLKYSGEKDAELNLLTAEMGIISDLFMNKVGSLLDELSIAVILRTYLQRL